tara:strand:- start:592 stop:789 length:198 start_codon:yes stop_codon:yes gene_type:complete
MSNAYRSVVFVRLRHREPLWPLRESETHFRAGSRRRSSDITKLRMFSILVVAQGVQIAGCFISVG